MSVSSRGLIRTPVMGLAPTLMQYVKVKSVSRSVVSNSLQPHGLM